MAYCKLRAGDALVEVTRNVMSQKNEKRTSHHQVEPEAISLSSEIAALTGQQRALYEALLDLGSAAKDENPRMAKMYFGAVLVLRQIGNPDRLALAAHGLRELMEKMPRFLDVYDRLRYMLISVIYFEK